MSQVLPPEPPSLYGYTPTTSVCFTFIGLFAVSASAPPRSVLQVFCLDIDCCRRRHTVIHGCEAVAYKLWWFLGLATLACVMEVFGWVGRLLSSFAPADLTAYTIQIVATVIAPTPLLASNFIILGMIIRHLGEQYSRLSSKWYSIVFTSADGIALIIQAFGGAKASHAVSTGQDPEPGGHIMLVGIVIQMIAITFYVILATEFFMRLHFSKPVRPMNYLAVYSPKKSIHRKMQFMIAGLSFSTLCIFIRTIYRTIELANGFTGRIIETQIYFNVLDGAMVVLASYTLNFLHPGYLLADVIEEERNAKKNSKNSKGVGKDSLPLSRSQLLATCVPILIYAHFTIRVNMADSSATTARVPAPFSLDSSLYSPTPEEAAFLKSQTKIEDDEELKQHVLAVQKEAWDVVNYRCIQAFGFMTLKISHLSAYRDLLALGKERSGAIFIDFACCFGNDARKAIADGYPMENVIASDIEKPFWELGHRLFKSTPETFPVPFVQGNVFDPKHIAPAAPHYSPPTTPRPTLSVLTSLTPLQGHVSVIHTSAFFHLFDKDGQIAAARALASLLSPLPGSMIFGTHSSTRVSGNKVLTVRKSQIYCFSPADWCALWDGVIFEKGSVTVDAVLEEKNDAWRGRGFAWDSGEDAQTKRYSMIWSVKRK
ncbi:hypothetical protein EW145_g2886 [Phellinidium pouzarii]|uniref:Methyltransferase domain-containing protein n=1 Tax=Phellinidium pouzarii TaxID=167371 RepID=A0A4S4L9P2_9AGAM|nr:hypothetical protein EW145_g2886 [Phellinidium pouzarii]